MTRKRHFISTEHSAGGAVEERAIYTDHGGTPVLYAKMIEMMIPELDP